MYSFPKESLDLNGDQLGAPLEALDTPRTMVSRSFRGLSIGPPLNTPIKQTSSISPPGFYFFQDQDFFFQEQDFSF